MYLKITSRNEDFSEYILFLCGTLANYFSFKNTFFRSMRRTRKINCQWDVKKIVNILFKQIWKQVNAYGVFVFILMFILD